MDILSAIFDASHMRIDNVVATDVRFDTAANFAGRTINLHFVPDDCQLTLKGSQEEYHIRGGGAVFLIKNQDHTIAIGRSLRKGTSTNILSVLSGYLSPGDPNANTLASLLPPILIIDQDDSENSGLLREIRDLLNPNEGAAGSSAIFARLMEIVLLRATRQLLNSPRLNAGGWITAFAHPHIGRALQLMHRSPDTNWTTSSLAKAVAMSRSAFLRHFSKVVGQPPLAYLTRRRIQMAVKLLGATGLTVGEISRRAGYASEAAFGKAFKRVVGVPPASYRRTAHASLTMSHDAESLANRRAYASAEGNLAEQLSRLASSFEELASPALCSILLVDESGERLCHGAAPSLPDVYNERIDGITIGPASGSCGTAAFGAQPVIVRDIQSSPLWKGYALWAGRYGLRSCWSMPILDSDGGVLGTFAIYHKDFYEPDGRELGLADHFSDQVRSILAEDRKRKNDAAHITGSRTPGACGDGTYAVRRPDAPAGNAALNSGAPGRRSASSPPLRGW